MPSDRTFVTEVAAGLGMAGGENPGQAIAARPAKVYLDTPTSLVPGYHPIGVWVVGATVVVVGSVGLVGRDG
jgi:hypothetical protein